jgi:hypothetical protein
MVASAHIATDVTAVAQFLYANCCCLIQRYRVAGRCSGKSSTVEFLLESWSAAVGLAQLGDQCVDRL